MEPGIAVIFVLLPRSQYCTLHDVIRFDGDRPKNGRKGLSTVFSAVSTRS